jgi:hypothetical protein
MTLKEVKAGGVPGAPLYVSKPYVLLSRENVVLASGTLEALRTELPDEYYDNNTVEVREHDLHLNDNTRIPGPERYRYELVDRDRVLHTAHAEGLTEALLALKASWGGEYHFTVLHEFHMMATVSYRGRYYGVRWTKVGGVA